MKGGTPPVVNKRWTDSEDTYVRESFGHVSFEDMGRRLGRSARSVRLYCLRRKLVAGGRTVKRNMLVELLRLKFRNLEDFTPSRAFYQYTGINQKRYWDLFFGRRQIDGREYCRVADYLGVTTQETFYSRQLELFGDSGDGQDGDVPGNNNNDKR